MQKQTGCESSLVLPPDPVYRYVRWYLVFLGSLLLLLAGWLFLPAPIRAALFLQNGRVWFLDSHIPPVVSMLIDNVRIALIPALLIRPFLCQFRPRKIKQLSENRRQALENERTGRTTAPFPLPKILAPLPPMLSIRLRRNWRATWIAGLACGSIMALLFSISLQTWLDGLQNQLHQGVQPVWGLFGSFFPFLAPLIMCLPAFMGFIFIPRQDLTATEEGLHCRQGLRLSFISWQQACLFGVIAQKQGVLVYELASATCVIRWSDRAVGTYENVFPADTVGIAPLRLARPVGSPDEYHEQISQLVAFVADRTGLPLYDLRLEEDTWSTVFFTSSTISSKNYR